MANSGCLDGRALDVQGGKQGQVRCHCRSYYQTIYSENRILSFVTHSSQDAS